ncbi:putative NBD/HSP70 family sugar kinase [Isoptericola sp. CG 20/1183]|uniref:NBD/HSP70 family sugar kinase n=2 Tax=Promicromonosporaceae TaxID=85017 RepID=A0ABX5EHH6_9MICO|nr:putative NBD/HSP70 family sugar kinase [Isoptericola halotolerans]PRZ07982.1 putative NBD/HSP70 family sugar kinase [Isoptericola sp. CG 20/1183]
MASPRLSVGLDIGGTKTLAVLLGDDGEVLAQSRLSTALGPVGVVDGAARAVQGVVRQAGVTLDAVTGVGVGVPGLVDAGAGTVRHAVNLGLDGAALDLSTLLSARLGGVGVGVENDLNVAAVGAAHLVEAEAGDRTPTDLAFLALGTGLAAGIVLDGRLRRGSHGAAGEIGHVPVDPAGPPCACGQRGCLELYASGSAVTALWPTATGRPAPVELFEAAAAGDPDALVARATYARAVAAAVRMLVLTVDVQHVVLGGGVSQLGQPLLDVVRDALVDESAASGFLRSLDLPGRVRLAPGRVAVGAVGAAVVGRGAVAHARDLAG